MQRQQMQHLSTTLQQERLNSKLIDELKDLKQAVRGN
jgi:hypothetical protein